MGRQRAHRAAGFRTVSGHWRVGVARISRPAAMNGRRHAIESRARQGALRPHGRQKLDEEGGDADGKGEPKIPHEHPMGPRGRPFNGP